MSHPAISSASDLTDPLTPALMLSAQNIGSSAAATDSLQLQAQSLPGYRDIRGMWHFSHDVYLLH
eukprot:3797775-Rhodomonas_salina.1